MKRAEAARWMARPPVTDPVNATKSTRGSPTTRFVSSWLRCSTWKQPSGRPASRKHAAKRLRAKRRLCRMLEHDHVAGHQRRHDAVDGDQVRVVPGGDREHDAERLASQEAPEPLLRPDVDVRERLGRDRDHVPCTLERAAHLVRPVADGSPHLPGEFLRDGVAPPLERFAETTPGSRHAIRRARGAIRAARAARGRASRR